MGTAINLEMFNTEDIGKESDANETNNNRFLNATLRAVFLKAAFMRSPLHGVPFGSYCRKTGELKHEVTVS